MRDVVEGGKHFPQDKRTGGMPRIPMAEQGSMHSLQALGRSLCSVLCWPLAALQGCSCMGWGERFLP